MMEFFIAAENDSSGMHWHQYVKSIGRGICTDLEESYLLNEGFELYKKIEIGSMIIAYYKKLLPDKERNDVFRDTHKEDSDD